jgi:hypothetical protein
MMSCVHNVPAITRLDGGRGQIGARVGVDGVRAPLRGMRRGGPSLGVREVGVGAR